MKKRLTILLAILVAIVATALLIYLTPLKHITLVPPTMNSMSAREFYTEFSAHPEEYIFVDVRSANIYTSAHATGAVNIPIENFYDQRNYLPRSGKQIVLICTTGRLAAVGYGYLENQGFTNLIHIEGGMVNWAAEGLPVEGVNITQGTATTISDEHQ